MMVVFDVIGVDRRSSAAKTILPLGIDVIRVYLCVSVAQSVLDLLVGSYPRVSAFICG
jgi:hypothetical protein